MNESEESPNSLEGELAGLEADGLAGELMGQDLTVGEFLDQWLEGHVLHTVRSATYVSYKGCIKKHIKPHLENYKLRDIKSGHIRALYSLLEKKKISPRTRLLVHSILRRSLGHAERWEVIGSNPVTRVDKPKYRPGQITPLTTEQAKDLLKATEKDRMRALYILAITTGMRQGELLGLQWEDIDFENKSLTVRHSLIENAKEFGLGEPKTARGRRKVELPDMAISALRAHREKMIEEKHGDKLIFCNTRGKPWRKTNLMKYSFRPLLEKAKLPRIRFHDLRHTAATLLLSQGVHPKVVQERLGHSQISVTLDTYSHVLPSMQKEAAAGLDGILAQSDDQG